MKTDGHEWIACAIVILRGWRNVMVFLTRMVRNENGWTRMDCLRNRVIVRMEEENGVLTRMVANKDGWTRMDCLRNRVIVRMDTDGLLMQSFSDMNDCISISSKNIE